MPVLFILPLCPSPAFAELQTDINELTNHMDGVQIDLPKKEDALLYQSKGKAGVGWTP